MSRTRGTHAGVRALTLTLALVGALAILGLGPSASALAGSPDASAAASAGAESSGTPGPGSPGFKPPVLAYYYIWFNAASWSHAKADQPALGPYTSTDPAIIRQQVTWAKQSGVDAFIVSWKSSPSLNLGLKELVAEANRQNLKLVVIYEGLDVNRNPIPVDTVENDLVWFENTYGSDPAFDLYGKPAVIWSGTWRFSDGDVTMVRNVVDAPNRLLLLGSEKSAAAYQARATLFDGDAYYWSSGDPLSTPGYASKLNALGQAVHAGGGLWLAPAAVGFDARLNGGTSVVDRRDGSTLTAGWSDALATGPDGIAAISWNEYTEGSYVEPSVAYGFRYLTVLSQLTGASGPSTTALPAATPVSPSPRPPAVTGAGALGSSAPGAGAVPSAPVRPQPLSNSPGSILFAVAVLAVLGLLGWRLRSAGRRELIEPKEGR
jgi:hypothetical protein